MGNINVRSDFNRTGPETGQQAVQSEVKKALRSGRLVNTVVASDFQTGGCEVGLH